MSTPTTTKPTIVCVVGAWFLPASFDPLRAILEEKSYPTVAVGHPSIGGTPPLTDFSADVSNLRNTLSKLIEEENKEVVLLLHSYGGIVGSCAAEGFGAVQRAREGKKGGILIVAYMSAFAVPKGTSTLDALEGGRSSPWMRYEDDKVYINVSLEALSDIPPAEQQKWAALISYTSAAAFEGKTTYEPWHDMPCMYLFCDEDEHLTPPVQEGMAKLMESGSGGRGVAKYHIKGWHNSFLSLPGEVAGGVEAAAREGVERTEKW
ncbi:MAG: hypothetical protein M1834_009575 [Cirrosporium novae-zelandiae]|nr:MAG: hypothetical protein M1834_009575 [Cirrosporium novae-zelandiae]